jgi:hypothetical protein
MRIDTAGGGKPIRYVYKKYTVNIIFYAYPESQSDHKIPCGSGFDSTELVAGQPRSLEFAAGSRSHDAIKFVLSR